MFLTGIILLLLAGGGWATSGAVIGNSARKNLSIAEIGVFGVVQIAFPSYGALLAADSPCEWKGSACRACSDWAVDF